MDVRVSKISSKPVLLFTGIKNYDTHINQYNVYLESKGLPVSADTLVQFWCHLIRKKKYTPATLNAKRTALKAGIKQTFGQEPDAFRFIQAIDGFFKSNIPSYRIDRSVKERELLKPKELRRLHSNATPKVALIIETLAKTGMRVSELISMDSAQSKKRGEFHYYRVVGKGRKEREIILSKELVDRIRDTFGKSKLSKLLFTNRNGMPYSRQYIHSEIRKHSERIIGRAIWPHQLRHYFATQKIIAEKKSVKAVSRYLGHSGVDITLEMYVHDSLAPEDLF